ncbi:MAG: TnpV protein [Clostridiales bacterium]|nr:TnpV protein [Clostridiales bacterium]
MKQDYIDEKTGISYTLQGDYYLPDLALPAEKGQPIGIWEQRHLRYLKEYRRITYLNLLTSGRLNTYLSDINQYIFTVFL